MKSFGIAVLFIAVGAWSCYAVSMNINLTDMLAGVPSGANELVALASYHLRELSSAAILFIIIFLAAARFYHSNS